tara:strand:+ start:1062 stop:2120 length:1059 start_codon:yes stop_codon:yes gene_type:complete
LAKKNKIVVICFGFEKKVLRSQPWNSVNKICDHYNSNKNDLFIISDRKKKFVNQHKIINIKKIFNFNSPSSELKKTILFIKPNKILIVIGSHELLLPLRFSEFKNLTLIIGNNRFNFKEILRISFLDFLKEFNLLFLPLFVSFVPSFLLKIGYKLAGSPNLIYLSKEAQKRYQRIGLSRGKIFIPFNKTISMKKKLLISKKKKIFLTYFGPPLNLRGLDIVFNAFELLVHKRPNLYLNLLIRNNNENHLKNNMIDLKKKVLCSKFNKNIILDTKYYSSKLLKEKIKKSTLNVLPFKITRSDTPIVIDDALKTKIPLFVLNTPGITEHVTKTNTYICEDENDLIYKLKMFLDR